MEAIEEGVNGKKLLTDSRWMGVIFCIFVLMMTVPVSAAIHSSSLKYPIQIPAFSIEKPHPVSSLIPWTGMKKIDAVTESEALEIAAEHGVKENPCCPGISIHRTVVIVDQRMKKVWRVAGPCGPVQYIDRFTGEIVKTDYIMCMCFCSDTKRT